MRPYRWIFIALSSFATFPLIENLACSSSSAAQFDFKPLFQFLGKCYEAVNQKNNLLFAEAYRSFRNTLYINSFTFNSYLKNSNTPPDFADYLAQCILYAIYYGQIFKEKLQSQGLDPTSPSYHTLSKNKNDSDHDAMHSNMHFVTLFNIIKAYVEVVRHRSTPQQFNQTSTDHIITDKMIDNIIDQLNQGAENSYAWRASDRQRIKSILEMFNISQNYRKIFQLEQSSYENQSIDPNINRSSALISKPKHTSNEKQSPRAENSSSALEDPFIIPDSLILNYKQSNLFDSKPSSAIDASSESGSSIVQPAESIQPLNKDAIDHPLETQAPQNESSWNHSSQKPSLTPEITPNSFNPNKSSNANGSEDGITEALSGANKSKNAIIQTSSDTNKSKNNVIYNITEESLIDACYEFFVNHKTPAEKYRDLSLDFIRCTLEAIASQDPALKQKKEAICEKLEPFLTQTDVSTEKKDPLYLRDLIPLNTQPD